MTALINDVKYSIRQLCKRPGFVAAAVLTLTLGLTVNAVVFTSVSDFFLRPLPVSDSEDLVVIAQKNSQLQFAFALCYPDFLDFRAAVENTETDNTGLARTFSGLMAYYEQAVHLSRTNELTERTWVHVVSNNYFSVLGVQPLHGRFFLPTEGQHEGADSIIVLTHHVWEQRFGANPDILGQSVKLNGVPFTVIGITPPDFHGAAFGTALSGFIPASMLREIVPGNRMFTTRGNTGFFLMGRLRPRVDFTQARQATELFMSQLVKAYPQNHTRQTKAVIMPERMSRPSPHVARFTPFIVSALMGLALLVLAVAIANVANLLFARAADQQQELAIRGAMGASRWRLLRQLLMESVVLAVVAGAVGVSLTFWISPLLNSMVPSPTAPFADLGVDWRLFVFTFVASLLTGVFTGLLPALKATKLNIIPALKESTRTLAGTGHSWRNLLVTGQVAISVVVLICAGLALRSLHRLTRVHLGFRTRNILLASFDLGLQRYTREQGQNFNTQLLEKALSLPGVTHVTLAGHVPFDVGGSLHGDIKPEGREQSENERFELIPCINVGDSFLQTVDIDILEGREFRPQDDRSNPRVAIVNRVLAEHFWPNQPAVGRTLLIDGRAHEVIGLIGECRYWSITDRNRPLVFRPLAQNYRGHLTLMVRTTGSCSPLRGAIEQIVRQLDPDLPVYNVQTMEQQVAGSVLGLMPMRMGATLAGVQGVLALLLAALGITGLVSFAVTQRTREIGIHMALGAQTKDVLKLVTQQGFRLTCVGLVVGLILALGVSHLLAGLLYSISPTDPIVFVGVITLIMITTLLAGWLPARRATKTNPMEALRYE